MNISFILNGKAINIDVDPNERLANVLRDRLGITSVKIGCENGTCGTCTVLMNDTPVQSCLLKMKTVQGKEIMTIEALGTPASLHPIQKAFIDHDAVQCGFCTPAMILRAYALLKKNPHPTRDEIKKAISPVLCRCTGYIPIIEAIEAVATGEYGRVEL